MAFKIIDPEVKVADKDIKVYRIITTINEQHHTVYKQRPIELKKQYESPFISVGEKMLEDIIVSYPDLRQLKRIKLHMHEKIVECTIPKGSKAYIGFHFGLISIASNYIIYNKVL